MTATVEKLNYLPPLTRTQRNAKKMTEITADRYTKNAPGRRHEETTVLR